MKKTVLILSVLGILFLMTSCLGDTTNNYSDNSFVYVDRDDNGQVYGKTFSYFSPSRLITSSAMMSMNPGSFKFIVYSWDETDGYTPIKIDGQSYKADNVKFAGQVIDISKTDLHLGGLPVVEDPVGFDEIREPIYANDKSFINDYWVLEYYYTAKKGLTGRVDFYKRNELNDKGEIVIDMVLTLTGTADATTNVKNGDAVAVNMTQLRSMIGGGSSDKNLKIRFSYYKNRDNAEPEKVESQNVYNWKIEED